MKKKLLTATLAVLAGAGLVLGSCGETPTSSSAGDSSSTTDSSINSGDSSDTSNGDSSSSSSSEGTSASQITWNRGASTDLVIGTPLDLTTVITINPSGASIVEVEAISDNVSVNGTTIEATEIGDWSIRVYAGSNRLPRVFNGNAISSELATLREFVSQDISSFTATAFALNSNHIKVGYLSSVVHDDQYVLFAGDTNTEWNGYGQIGNNFYSIAYNSQNETTTVDPGSYPPLEWWAAGQGWTLESSQLSDAGTSIEDNYVSISGEDLYYFSFYNCSLGLNSLAQSKGIVTAITDETSGEITAIQVIAPVSELSSMGIVAVAYVLEGINEDFAPALTTFLGNNENAPAKLDSNGFEEALTSIGAEKKSYTITSSTELGYFNNSDAWVETTDPAVYADLASRGWEFTFADYTAYVTGEDYVAIDEEGALTAYVINDSDSTLHQVQGTYSDGVGSNYSDSGAMSIDSIWGEGIVGMSDGMGGAIPVPFTPVDITDELLAANDYYSVTTSGTVTTIDISAYSDLGNFLTYVLATFIPISGAIDAYYCSALQFTDMPDPDMNWSAAFDYFTATYDSSTGNISFDAYLSGLAIDGDNMVGVRWTSEVSNIGSTTEASTIADAINAALWATA